MLLWKLPALLNARPLKMTDPYNGRRVHVYAGNPLKNLGGAAAADDLAAVLSGNPGGPHKVLPLQKGRALTQSEADTWRLRWVGPAGVGPVPAEEFVYLGSAQEGAHYWAVEVGEMEGEDGSAFVDVRTLMHAAGWADETAAEELAVAGHAKALVEWHRAARFCGRCGGAMRPIDGGRRRECSDSSCGNRSYPRVDPVVIMLVVDKENDRALLSRQYRYAPRMWSCLAGFAEPGESLEEAVRRETWEETGIRVGEVVYHSSQPWPVGRSSMPCQLMVGFIAYAKSLDIKVDRNELEDARWHSREDVKRALAFAEYEAARRATAEKVNQMCNGGYDESQRPQVAPTAGSSELGPMYVPGPYAIAHHLISSWVNEGGSDSLDLQSIKSTSLSSL